MASYLATINVGEWDVRRWRTEDGIPVYDAVDPALTGGLRDEIDSSLARQEEMLDVLTPSFGPYPFNALGGIVDNQSNLFFALETQTRPVYSKYFWLNNQGEPTNGDFVVVHELAHQWFGDDVALARWRDIWLNEGFATYAEWLWTEDQGGPTPRATFQQLYDAIPANDPFWSLRIGDPGADRLFDDAVYVRGAMTAQALRNEIGRADFFRLLRRWTSSKSGGNGTTGQFIALAEQVSEEQLDDLFDAWLYTPAKPEASVSSGPVRRGTLGAPRPAAGSGSCNSGCGATGATEHRCPMMGGVSSWAGRRRAQFGGLDAAVYGAIAATPTPDLDRDFGRLSRAADHSKLWMATAAAMALAGPRGKEAAVDGLTAVAVTSAVVNLGMKSFARRRRPDRLMHNVPLARQVRMPVSTSFPSGHSASAFAFATAASDPLPAVSGPLQLAAGLVAYSRVHTGVHYPLDAIVGSLVGAAIAPVTTAALNRLRGR